MAGVRVGLDVVLDAEFGEVAGEPLAVVAVDEVFFAPAADHRTDAGERAGLAGHAAVERRHHLQGAAGGVQQCEAPAHAEAHHGHLGDRLIGLFQHPLPAGVELVEGVAVAGFVVAQGAHHAQAFGAGPVVEIRRQHRVAVVGEPLRDARLVVAEAEDVVDDDHRRVQAVGPFGQEPAGTHAVAVGYGDVGILGAHGHSLA